MSFPESIDIETSTGPITANFGEATAEQVERCKKLGATAFRHPLPTDDYLEREAFLDKLPLFQDSGRRTWCLFNAATPLQVLATCKTIERDLLVRDKEGTHSKRGYCIASVVCDSGFRKQGLASFLLAKLAEWMDGPGQGTASFLYTSIEAFYESKGWHSHPSLWATIKPPTFLEPVTKTSFPCARNLKSSDLRRLCDRDVRRVAEAIEALQVTDESVHLAVRPTADLVSWLHQQSEFVSRKLNGAAPETKGAIDQDENTWAYWCCDFRKDQLAIQRISSEKLGHAPVKVLAGLLCNAINEAARWGLRQVSIWNPTPDVQEALRLLSDETTCEIVFQEKREIMVPMLRLKHGEKRAVFFEHNEF